MLDAFLNAWDIYEINQQTVNSPTSDPSFGPLNTNTNNNNNTPNNANNNSGGSSRSNYVYYIQYTIKLNGHPVSLNGLYNQATRNAVFAYQTAKNVRPPDGIVDSQTKSSMATYWLNLYKYNKPRFDKLLSEAPDQAKPYITRAVKYSDISAVCSPSSSDEYRRISYTGTQGPTKIQDYIVVEVPQLRKKNGGAFDWQELASVNIRAGGWSLGIKQIFLYEQDLAASTHQVPQIGANSIKASASNIIQAQALIQPNGSLSIPVGNKRKIKYVMIEVYGNGLKDGVHGPNAEGFSIRDITFTIQTPELPIEAQEPKYTTIDDIPATATASGTIFGETELSSGDVGVFNLGTISQAIASAARSKINQITLNNISVTVNPIVDGAPLFDDEGNPVRKTFSKSFNETIYSSDGTLLMDDYEWEEDKSIISVKSMSTSSSIDGANPVINSVVRTGPTGTINLSGSEISQQFSILKNRAPKYVITTTNGIEIISTEISEEFPVDSFYLADADIEGLRSKQNTKLSVNAKDGVVVLTNSLGNPTGFPDYSKFVQPNIETSFGSTILKWDLKDSSNQLVAPPDGLQWGFYNIRTRQFLGIKLSYQYYLTNKRDIFIAVHAYDADRDVSTMENIIGIDNRVGVLTEFNLPAKSICPIYSVKVNPRAKISISNPPKDLSKFDMWFVNLSRGRFYKKIEVPIDYNFVDWKKNYKGTTLRCFYDTTKIQIPSSPIFGSGYYDIFEEHPIILSETEIQLRHGSFVVAQEQINKESVNTIYTDASPIEPWFEIWIKNKQTNEFEKVSNTAIKNYNKHTGVISFSKEIVPSNDKFVKVNYTVKNPNAMLYHINGREIPLNPYSNSQMSWFDNGVIKTTDEDYPWRLNVRAGGPIHFYIVPKTIEEMIDGEYIEIPDYSEPDSIVDFTYDFNLFNKNSISYNPFAVYLGTAVVINDFNLTNFKIADLRVKGGGVSPITEIIKESESLPGILSFNDVQSGKGKVYPNGGYVVVQIPKEVKDNFKSIDEIYSIVRSNLTAGVAFDIQDMDGNDWRTL